MAREGRTVTHFNADPDSLRRAGRDIAATVSRATSLDVRGAAGEAEWYGDPVLAGAAGEFATTWQVGIAALVERAHAHRARLDAAAQRYEQTDGGGAQLFTRAAGPLPE